MSSNEEVRTTSATGGEKGRKPAEIAWIDPQSLLEVAAVARMGADKYGDHNFRRGYEWSKCFNAAFRHLAAFWSGQNIDDESRLPHLAHAAWHCLALLSFMREHPEYDDRYKPAPKITVPQGSAELWGNIEYFEGPDMPKGRAVLINPNYIVTDRKDLPA